MGYEDLNDHESLRADLAVQTAVEREAVLASSATLCRWENRADRDAAWRVHAVMLDQFIHSFKRAPKELILDFDATDDAVHGKQEGRFFHGYYDQYCFLPLYVFCRERIGKSIRLGVELLPGSGSFSTLVGFQGDVRPARGA